MRNDKCAVFIYMKLNTKKGKVLKMDAAKKQKNKEMMENLYKKREKKKGQKGKKRLTFPKIENQLTLETYKKLKENKISDSAIMEKFGMNNNVFYEWKKENDLIAKRKPIDVPAEETKEERVTLKNSTDQIKEELKTCKELLEGANNANTITRNELEALQEKYSKLLTERNSLFDDSGSKGLAIKEQQEEIERLTNLKTDYISLERDYRLLERRNKELNRWMDRLKHTETINLMIMEQYVNLNKQIEEVL